jgi:TolB-like protein
MLRRWFDASLLMALAFGLLASRPARADVDPDADNDATHDTKVTPKGRKVVVAVMPFTSPTQWNLMGRNAQESFVTALVQTRKMRVIQATEVQRMLRRESLHWTGTMDPRLLKAAGRFLKADYMMGGKLRYTGDAYTLSVHVMNVKSLETTMAEDVDFSDAGKMRIAVRVAAKKIAGAVTGTGSGSSKADLFLNVNPRAFYDTADACIRAMGYVTNTLQFSGTVESVDEEQQTVEVKGYAGNLKEGVPLDVYSTSGIGDATKLTTVFVTKKRAGGFTARWRAQPEEGSVELGSKVTNRRHKWTVAVGKVEDEVEDNDKLVKRFRSALLEKMSEGDKFQEIEGGSTDTLAKLSNRRTRFMTFKALFKRGIDLVLEGKFYGSSGSRRAHFKIYSTLTGKVWGEPKFETSL